MRNAFLLLREDLREKARRAGKTGPAAIAGTLADAGTSAVILHRLAQGTREAGLLPLALAFGKINAVWNRCIIDRGAEIGPGLVIHRPSGIVIEGRARCGARLTLDHEVSIGSRGSGPCPVLGDDVEIGPGAKVIGPVAVGDGARVGVDAVVVKDVPPFAAVEGIPARPVKSSSSTGTSR
ncbi:MAG: serine acetyltransferase [Minicystis sp.]